MNYAILVGNGLSITYKDDLAIGPLTTVLLERFQEQGGELLALAEDAHLLVEQTGQAVKGFEDLLGPFDAVSAMIQSLPGLRAGSSLDSFRHLVDALEVSRDIHLQGVAHALDVIADLGHLGGSIQNVDRFCQAVADLGEPDELVTATLSYDGLLQSGFLREWVGFTGSPETLAICDLGHGLFHEQLQVDFADEALDAYRLRDFPDFPDNRAVLLHLHGSLGWLRAPGDNGDVFKFRIQDLRDWHYWDRLKAGDTGWTPVVVLTSRKTELVREWPFSLAYTSFASALSESDRWLIAGYGRGDEPVNTLYRTTAEIRRNKNEPAEVLVVGRGDQDALRQQTSELMGIPEGWITACGEGLADAVDCGHWFEVHPG